jgi:hypothetical protein
LGRRKNKNKFKFKNSAYNVLIDWIKHIIKKTYNSQTSDDGRIIKKVIVQAIMIKYFEERRDADGKSPFSEEYYNQISIKEGNLVDILKSGINDDNASFISTYQ